MRFAIPLVLVLICLGCGPKPTSSDNDSTQPKGSPGSQVDLDTLPNGIFVRNGDVFVETKAKFKTAGQEYRPSGPFVRKTETEFEWDPGEGRSVQRLYKESGIWYFKSSESSPAIPIDGRGMNQ